VYDGYATYSRFSNGSAALIRYIPSLPKGYYDVEVFVGEGETVWLHCRYNRGRRSGYFAVYRPVAVVFDELFALWHGERLRIRVWGQAQGFQ
jgi:hypothetical protein